MNGTGFVTLAVLAALLSCGSGGSGASEDANSGPGTVREINSSCADIRGKIIWQGESSELPGTEVWLLDHASFTHVRRSLKSDGTFTLDCPLFSEGHVYTLHVVHNFRLVADLDFSAVDAGVQGAFSYAGGLGFDLGSIEVPLGPRGEVAFIAAGLPARVKGGFRVLPEIQAGISSFGGHDILDKLGIGSQLVLTNPRVILDAFYLNASFPGEYSRELGRASRISLFARAADRGGVRRVRGENGPRWFLSSRTLKSQTAANSSFFWSEIDFNFEAGSNDSDFNVTISSGVSPSLGDLIGIQVFTSKGEIRSYPRYFSEIVGFPPKILSYGTGNPAQASVIDYGSGLSNGLTRPFCQIGDVAFQVAPPRDRPPENPGSHPLALGAGTQIEVGVEYYPEASSIVEPMVVDSSEFTGVFTSAFSEIVAGTLARSWNPKNQTMIFSRSDGIYDSQELTIPRQVLLGLVKGATVENIRFVIKWIDKNTQTMGATVLWLKKSCS